MTSTLAVVPFKGDGPKQACAPGRVQAGCRHHQHVGFASTTVYLPVSLSKHNLPLTNNNMEQHEAVTTHEVASTIWGKPPRSTPNT